jgi:hypothetical protein
MFILYMLGCHIDLSKIKLTHGYKMNGEDLMS